MCCVYLQNILYIENIQKTETLNCREPYQSLLVPPKGQSKIYSSNNSLLAYKSFDFTKLHTPKQDLLLSRCSQNEDAQAADDNGHLKAAGAGVEGRPSPSTSFHLLSFDPWGCINYFSFIIQEGVFSKLSNTLIIQVYSDVGLPW